MAFTRLPSARRASTIGLVASTRRPTRLTIRWTICSRCSSLANVTSDFSSRPRRSQKMVLGPLIRMSLIVGSRSSVSRGPRPKVSSMTSLTSCSRSAALITLALVRQSSSAAVRISARNSSSLRVPIFDRSRLEIRRAWNSHRTDSSIRRVAPRGVGVPGGREASVLSAGLAGVEGLAGGAELGSWRSVGAADMVAIGRGV